MLTLLLLLGAVAAGAGIYTLFQEPEKKAEKFVSAENRGSGGYNRGKEITPGSGAGKNVSGQSSEGGKPGKKAEIPEVQPPDKNKEKIPSLTKKSKKAKLTYSADEIITNNSKYSFHHRPLMNAETLVEKENYNGALEIFKRTNARIKDEEINFKINQNINDLTDYLETDEQEEESYTPDYSSAEIPIKDLVHAIKDISEAIANSLGRSFQVPFMPKSSEQTQAPGPMPPPSSGLVQATGQVDVTGQVQALGQILQGSGSVVQIPPEVLAEWKSDNKNLDSLVNPVVFQIFQSVAPETFKKPQGLNFPEEEEEVPPVELPEDTFFSEEWDKYKDLPLKDRRSHEERRKDEERRTGEDRKKDRRSGEDRREVDLFKEREDYLNQKAEERKKAIEDELKERDKEKQQKKAEQPKSEPEIIKESLNSSLLPEKYLPIAEEPIAIALPDPTDKQLFLQEESGKFHEFPEHEIIDRPDYEELEEKEIPSPINESIGLPDPEDLERSKGVPEEEPPEEKKVEEPEEVPKEEAPEIKPLGQASPEEAETPEIEVVEGNMAPMEETPEEPETEPEKVIHGILELKPPEEDDAPFLTLTYDFSKIPDSFRLSKNYSVMEYGYYKYKPMLMKAQEFARRKMLKNALNYYRVIKSQNVPPELKGMINRNIKDITEFLEKYLMAKGG